MALDSKKHNLEIEIQDIKNRLKEKMAQLNKETERDAVSSESTKDKKILHEIVGEKIREKLPELNYKPEHRTDKINGSQDSSTKSALFYLPSELKVRIQELVNTVFLDSFDKAIAEVKKSNNPALVDAFHDVLTDQLYGKLIKRGILKKV